MSAKRIKEAAETVKRMNHEKRERPKESEELDDTKLPSAKRQKLMINTASSQMHELIMDVSGVMNDATGLKMQGSDTAKELESGFVPEKFEGELKNDDIVELEKGKWCVCVKLSVRALFMYDNNFISTRWLELLKHTKLKLR